MFFNILQTALFSIVARLTFNGSMIVLTTLAVTAVYLFWRIWTFTIIPALSPEEPKELPYFVPSTQAGNFGLQYILTKRGSSGWVNSTISKLQPNLRCA